MGGLLASWMHLLHARCPSHTCLLLACLALTLSMDATATGPSPGKRMSWRGVVGMLSPKETSLGCGQGGQCHWKGSNADKIKFFQIKFRNTRFSQIPHCVSSI